MSQSKITRRHFLKTIGVGLTTLVVPHPMNSNAQATKSPNIVLIMADDMGYSDIGCYGGEIQTPNLDKLASNGIRFTHFYNGARCCPSRAALLTGLYAHQTGMGDMESDWGLPGYRGNINRQCVTLAEALKLNGYATYMSGKWHLTNKTRTKTIEDKFNWPCQRGFDRFYGTITGAGSYFDPHTLTRDNENIEHEVREGEYYYTDAISDNAVGFIDEHFQSYMEEPFFLYVAYTAPHWPLHIKEADIAKYKGRYDAGWDKLRKKRLKRLIEMEIIDPRWELTERDSRVEPWEKAENKSWEVRRMEVYAAQVDCMDQGIGKIIRCLEKHGQLENTLILFLSDNGGCAEVLSGEGWRNFLVSNVARVKTRDGRKVRICNDPEVMPGDEDTYQSYGIPWANLSNTPFRLYKHYIHEGGIATPLIMHWPSRIKARGELRHQVSHLIDIMPTVLEAAGGAYPEEFRRNRITPMEGVSLIPVIDNKALPERALFWEHHGNRAVRWGKWKLVAKGEQAPWELYDMEADRTELNDLVQHKPDLVEKMADMWLSWAERTNVLPMNPNKKKRAQSLS